MVDFTETPKSSRQSTTKKFKALYGFQGLFVKLDEWKIHF
jgi:hypothetical protein